MTFTIASMLFLSLFFISCDQGAGSISLTNTDSSNIALAYLKAHSNESNIQALAKTTFQDTTQKKFSAAAWAPLPWSTVENYSFNHDQSPLMVSQGNIVKGLMIDATGLSAVRALPATVKKIYLRFGKKPTGEYTIMVLPVDGNNNVRKSDNMNYDHLDPCPTYCPANFQ